MLKVKPLAVIKRLENRLVVFGRKKKLRNKLRCRFTTIDWRRNRTAHAAVEQHNI